MKTIFSPITIAGYYGCIHVEYKTSALLTAVETLIKSGFTAQPALSKYPDREVYRIPLDAQQAVYLKRYHITQPKQQLQTLFYAHKAQKSWRIAHILLKKGLATPRPLALLTRRSAWFRGERILLTEGIPGGLSLRESVRHSFESIPKKRAFIRAVAEFLAHLHRSGVYHGDFTAGNIFIQTRDLFEKSRGGHEEFRVYVIDLDSVRSTFRITRRRRIKNLDELGRNFLDLRLFSTSDRLRFLKYYWKAYEKEPRTLHELFREVHQRTQFRLHKHCQCFIHESPPINIST